MAMPKLTDPDLLRDACLIGGKWVAADDARRST